MYYVMLNILAMYNEASLSIRIYTYVCMYTYIYIYAHKCVYVFRGSYLSNTT